MRLAIPFVIALSIAGCAASDNSQVTPLSGRWGGDQVEVRDSTPGHETIVRLSCDRFVFQGQIAVDSTGHFAATGSSAARANYPATTARIAGKMYPDSIVFVLDISNGLGGSPPLTLHYTAYSGKSGDFSDLCPE